MDDPRASLLRPRIHVSGQVAEASVFLMRTLTDANAVKIDGISDGPENVKVWKQYAPEAYTLLKDLHKVSGCRGRGFS